MPKLDGPRILLMDLAQPSNAGDEAMQKGLLQLTRARISENIFAMSYFGNDDFTKVSSEFNHYPDSMGTKVGAGLSNTYLWTELSTVRKLLARFRNAGAILGFFLFYSAGLARFAEKFFLSERQRQTLAIVAGSEIVIWNGRNIRGSGRKTSEALKIFELLANALVAIALKKPVYCIGMSVWPLRSAISKTLLRYVVKHCHGVWVRERKSLEILAQYEPESALSVNQSKDLAFYALNELTKSESVRNSIRSRDLIAITLVGRKELGGGKIHADYITAFSYLVSYLGARGYRVRIVRQVSYALEPYDEEINLILAQNPQVSVEVTAVAESLEDLCAAYAEARLLVGSRMHSVIFARAVGTPVIGVSYDSGSKWSILEDVSEPPPVVLEASALKENSLAVAFEKIIELDFPQIAVPLEKYAIECEGMFNEVRRRSLAEPE